MRRLLLQRFEKFRNCPLCEAPLDKELSPKKRKLTFKCGGCGLTFSYSVGQQGK